MAMTQPDPRRQPAAGADAARIDWPRVLAENDRWLRTIVAARLGEPQAIDEVMQDVSMAAVRQHAPLSDPAKVGAWLYRLAVRQTLLYRRKQGRRRVPLRADWPRCPSLRVAPPRPPWPIGGRRPVQDNRSSRN